MSGIGGSALAMNQTLKANRALRKQRLSFKEINERYGSYTKKTNYEPRISNPEVVHKIRQKLKKRNRRSAMLKLLVLSFGAILIGTLLYQLLFSYHLV